MKKLLNKKVIGIGIMMFLTGVATLAQSNVVSPNYKYYQKIFVFPSKTKVDSTVYKNYEVKQFPNNRAAIEAGLTIGDYYALPPVNGKSFVVKILELPLQPTTNGSIENTTIYMSREIKTN